MVLSYIGLAALMDEAKIIMMSKCYKEVTMSLLIEHQIKNGMRVILNLSHDEHLCLFLYM